MFVFILGRLKYPQQSNIVFTYLPAGASANVISVGHHVKTR